MKKIFLLPFLFFFFTQFKTFSLNEDIPKPLPNRLIHDFSDVLKPEEELNLENKLIDFNNQTSVEVAIVTVNDIYGYDINEYAAIIGEKWGIGKKDKDNGIIILICPSIRKISIQVGYGLEGVIPDALAKRIIEKEIKPEFQKGNYYVGLDKATNILISLAKGEFSEEDKKVLNEQENLILPLLIGLFIIIFAFVIIIITNIHNVKQLSSKNSKIPLWLLLLLMMNNSSKSSRGSYGRFSSGGGSFGGFGGFGGGSFGGGGASGSW